MNILIIKLSAIGDVVHTLPSLAALRRHYAGADITWVVEETAADLIKDHPYLNRIIISRRKSWIRDFKNGLIRKPIREIHSLISEIRQRPYDLVIDFHGLFKSALIVLLSSGKVKLGYDSMQELSGLFLNEKIPEDMEKHAVDRYLDFPRHLGADVGQPEFLIPIEEQNKKRVEGLLNANCIDKDEGFIAVSPIALWETKLWDDKKFAGLCDRLIEELGVRIVFTGSNPQEIESIHSLMSQPSLNLGGLTSLRDLAYLYKLATLLITTDSGPMHLAAAVGTPVAALFGPTDPARTGPYGSGHLIIRKELACSPCFLKNCDDKKCMREIALDEVYERIKGRFF